MNDSKGTPPTASALLPTDPASPCEPLEGCPFTPFERERLRAAARVLVPHDSLETDLAGAIEDRLIRRAGHHRRDPARLSGPQQYRALLASLPADFLERSDDGRDEALDRAQEQHPRAFEDLLAELVEVFYTHPLIQTRLALDPAALDPAALDPAALER